MTVSKTPANSSLFAGLRTDPAYRKPEWSHDETMRLPGPTHAELAELVRTTGKDPRTLLHSAICLGRQMNKPSSFHARTLVVVGDGKPLAKNGRNVRIGEKSDDGRVNVDGDKAEVLAWVNDRFQELPRRSLLQRLAVSRTEPVSVPIPHNNDAAGVVVGALLWAFGGPLASLLGAGLTLGSLTSASRADKAAAFDGVHALYLASQATERGAKPYVADEMDFGMGLSVSLSERVL